MVGVDQTLVDADARVTDEPLARYALPKGSSTLIANDRASELYDELFKGGQSSEFASCTVANTLHNFSLLADDAAILLGVMSAPIRFGCPGTASFRPTSSRVSLDHLQPVDGPIGCCFALVTPDGERTCA